MSFTTLMYHEIRESLTFSPGQPSCMDVRQNYEDNLPPKSQSMAPTGQVLNIGILPA